VVTALAVLAVAGPAAALCPGERPSDGITPPTVMVRVWVDLYDAAAPHVLVACGTAPNTPPVTVPAPAPTPAEWAPLWDLTTPTAQRPEDAAPLAQLTDPYTWSEPVRIELPEGADAQEMHLELDLVGEAEVIVLTRQHYAAPVGWSPSRALSRLPEEGVGQTEPPRPGEVVLPDLRVPFHPEDTRGFDGFYRARIGELGVGPARAALLEYAGPTPLRPDGRVARLRLFGAGAALEIEPAPAMWFQTRFSAVIVEPEEVAGPGLALDGDSAFEAGFERSAALSADQIRTAIVANIDALNGCNPSSPSGATGEVHLFVEGGGSAVGVFGELDDPGAEACLVDVLATMAFPEAAGAPIRVDLPVTFPPSR
jgi:hypothetical protein